MIFPTLYGTYTAAALAAALSTGAAAAEHEQAPKLRRARSECDSDGAAPAADLTVLTRNLYLGADASLVFEGRVGELAQQFFTTDYPLRAKALAKEVCKTKPDLIGLQEVTTVTFLSDGITSPPVVIDFVEILEAEISARCGAYYKVEAVSTNLEFTLPLSDIPQLPGYNVGTSRDEDVILVNADKESLSVKGSDDGLFAAALPVPGFATILRGWCLVDVVLEGRKFRFINTHIEQGIPFLPEAEPVNVGQVAELVGSVVAATPSDTGLIVAGDFNCIPESTSYGILTSVLTDAWDEGRPAGDDGLTCCQDIENAILSNKETQLSARIDYVFSKSSADGTVVVEGKKAFLVGDKRFQNDIPYWASDHAGVAAKFDLYCNANGD